MRIYRNKTVMIAIGLMAASCAYPDEVLKDDLTPDGEKPLKVAVNTGKAEITKSLITTHSLADGSEIGIALYDADGNDYNGHPYKNVCFTAGLSDDGQYWTPERDVMLSSEKAELYAYYPYSGTVNDISSIPVSASSDVQTDYMFAQKVSGLYNKQPEASIIMKHALSAIRLSVKRGSYTGKGKITKVSVKGDVIASEAMLDAMTGRLSEAIPSENGICPPIDPVSITTEYQNIEIIVVPIIENKSPIEINIEMDGAAYTITTDEVTLQQGNIAVFEAIVNNREISIASVSVGDWGYTAEGNPVINHEWKVTITGNTQGLSFANSILEDGSIEIIAVPLLNDAEVRTVSVTGTASATQTVNESRGSRRILLSNIQSDINVSFNSYDLWITTRHNITDISSPTRLSPKLNTDDRSNFTRMKIDGKEVTPSNTYQFDAAGEYEIKFVFGSNNTIPSSAFSSNRHITYCRIPEGIETISTYSFNFCTKMETLELPQSVQVIKYSAFPNCYALKSIRIPEHTTIGYGLFSGCTSLEEAVLPTHIRTLPASIFSGCTSLKHIDIPETVTKIDYGALRGTGLTSLEIPAGVTEIAEETCARCEQLESISLPGHITTIKRQAFDSCRKLKEIRFSGYDCPENTLRLPDQLEHIESLAFYDCAITSVYIPARLSKIEYGAFCMKNLNSITVESGNPTYTTVEGFTGLIEKDTGTLIVGGAGSAVVPESVTIIGTHAYYNINLSSIDLHENISTVRKLAFYTNANCLSKITCRSTTPPVLDGEMIFLAMKYGRILVPEEAIETYRNSDWLSTEGGYLGYCKWAVQAIPEGE